MTHTIHDVVTEYLTLAGIIAKRAQHAHTNSLADIAREHHKVLRRAAALLRAHENVTTHRDGWIGWTGGYSPPDTGGRLVTVMLRNGTIDSGDPLLKYRWTHEGADDDIVAYKEIPIPHVHADGWIPFDGKDAVCPVRLVERVEVKYRDGTIDLGEGRVFTWHNIDGIPQLDIIAYRLLTDKR